MKTTQLAREASTSSGGSSRGRLLAGIPMAERRVDAAGIATSVLEGGEGPPLVLLHGPGGSAVKWFRVLPDLLETHRVVAPDLPGHGGTNGADSDLGEELVLAWLGALIEQTCASPPVLVGHVVGGAIAARFAVRHGDRLNGLVLVDSLGLAPFRPTPRFLLGLVGFQIRPTPRSHERLMRQCSADLDAVRSDMGDLWEPFAADFVEYALRPEAKAVGRLLRTVGLPRIPGEELASIRVPTALIWGRQDRANRLEIAERASERYGWPLHVLERCADEPSLDQPKEFVKTLHSVVQSESFTPSKEIA